MGSDLWSNGTGVTSKWAQEYLQYHICHAVTPILFAIAQSIYADTGATLAQSCRYQLYLILYILKTDREMANMRITGVHKP